MGNKKKLINKGLIDLFPNDINMFVDLFAGSAIVSMNVHAKKYIVNDINTNLYELYTMFAGVSSDIIIGHIEQVINKYGLARERTKRIEYKDRNKIEEYKKAYTNLRNYYNNSKERNTLDFYTLMFYSFSQQFRFNTRGEFNMPCGNDCFSDKNKDYIANGCNFFTKPSVSIVNRDFRELKISKLSEEDFVYIDPPYLNTTATYNESNGWIESDEDDLYSLCENLNKQHIKFGLSNVFENKGNENTKLKMWCYNMGWNIHMFDKFSYMACGKGNSNAKEVLITNY